MGRPSRLAIRDVADLGDVAQRSWAGAGSRNPPRRLSAMKTERGSRAPVTCRTCFCVCGGAPLPEAPPRTAVVSPPRPRGRAARRRARRSKIPAASARRLPCACSRGTGSDRPGRRLNRHQAFNKQRLRAPQRSRNGWWTMMSAVNSSPTRSTMNLDLLPLHQLTLGFGRATLGIGTLRRRLRVAWARPSAAAYAVEPGVRGSGGPSGPDNGGSAK